MILNLSDHALPVVSKAILVTGSARSGTTIMGKIIHSLESVEYIFEPPMMFSLFALSRRMPEDSWRLLYETYLYEEFMLNALAGRSLNCNISDDSSVYRVKSSKEVEERLKSSLSKPEAEERAKSHTVAYKLPDVVPFVPDLMQRYPETRVVVMLRGAVETLNSLLKKRWFCDDVSALVWPFRKSGDVEVPFWVREEDDELWAGLSELDRVAYYYIRVNENVDDIEGCIKIKYTQLLQDPSGTVGVLAERLGLKFGEKTEEVLAQIEPTHPKRDHEVMRRIDPRFREQVAYYSALSEP